MDGFAVGRVDRAAYGERACAVDPWRRAIEGLSRRGGDHPAAQPSCRLLGDDRHGVPRWDVYHHVAWPVEPTSPVVFHFAEIPSITGPGLPNQRRLARVD